MNRINLDLEICSADQLSEVLLQIIRENFSGKVAVLTYPKGSRQGMLDKELGPAWEAQHHLKGSHVVLGRKGGPPPIPPQIRDKYNLAMEKLFAEGYLARNPFQNSEDAFILAPEGGRKRAAPPRGEGESPPMAEGASREVRKVVVFTDIEGFTRYRAEKGDKKSYDVLMFHDKLLIKHFESLGGKLVKTIGDALMAVFESEKDAVLSVARIQRDLQDYNRRFPGDPLPKVRVGVDAGVVDLLMRHGTPDYLGQVVDRASRINGLAKGGEIWVSGVVADAARGRFGESSELKISFEDRGRPELKGLGPFQVYELKWSGS